MQCISKDCETSQMSTSTSEMHSMHPHVHDNELQVLVGKKLDMHEGDLPDACFCSSDLQ